MKIATMRTNAQGCRAVLPGSPKACDYVSVDGGPADLAGRSEVLKSLLYSRSERGLFFGTAGHSKKEPEGERQHDQLGRENQHQRKQADRIDCR